MRVAFVTIGQSPRTDVVPALVETCRTRFGVTERGVLDGMDDRGIAVLAPQPGEPVLASPLADGRGVIIGQAETSGAHRAAVTNRDRLRDRSSERAIEGARCELARTSIDIVR